MSYVMRITKNVITTKYCLKRAQQQQQQQLLYPQQQLSLRYIDRHESEFSRRRPFSESLLVIDEEVRDAIVNHYPVVALESTILAHGMPYPDNVQLSQRMNTIIRHQNAIPATIAIKNGKCHIGLSKLDIEDLANSGQPDQQQQQQQQQRARKCSTREISVLLSKHTQQQRHTTQPSQNQWGATTVAATMRLAHMAGISTFVTGGIGGVHRDGHDTMDVSADLIELSRTPVIVVSAGIKSILDIPRTLEVLETYGVPVIAYKSDEFPAFFSPKSGIQTPERMDTADQIATAYMMAQELALPHGFLIGVPNADPAGIHVEAAIQAALIEATEQGITGRDITPFILKYVAAATQGDSLRSNMALVEHNATIGARIAVAVALLKREKMIQTQQSKTVHGLFESKVPVIPKSRVIVVGGIVLDIIARPIKGQSLTLGTSNPAICVESDGGVGRNIAETLSRLGSRPLLYSAVGKDTRGKSMLRRLQDDCGITSLEHTVQTVQNANTATYIAILNEHRDLHTACADMEVLNQVITPPFETLQHAEYLVLDANPPIDVLLQTAKNAVMAGTKVFFDPTSVPKAKKLCAHDQFLSCISIASPNLDELYAMVDGTTTATSVSPDDLDEGLPLSAPTDDFNEEFIQSNIYPAATTVVKRMHPNVAHLIITCGHHGVILATKVNPVCVNFQRFHAPKNLAVENATGAGDTLSGAFIHALLNGKTIPDAITFGMKAAAISLQCTNAAISPSLSLASCKLD